MLVKKLLLPPDLSFSSLLTINPFWVTCIAPLFSGISRNRAFVITYSISTFDITHLFSPILFQLACSTFFQAHASDTSISLLLIGLSSCVRQWHHGNCYRHRLRSNPLTSKPCPSSCYLNDKVQWSQGCCCSKGKSSNCTIPLSLIFGSRSSSKQ